jgi:eukaryotic-like serine/threonine-protein kinase
VASASIRLSCPLCRAVFRRDLLRCPADGSVLKRMGADPLVGTLIADRYQIEHLIGEGGTGRVYRAREQVGGHQFAIKVLFGEYAADPRHRERFIREVSSTSLLRHPNIIAIHDYGSSAEGLPYMVMEHVEGRSLSTILRHDAPLASARARRLLGDLCLALECVHGAGVVHRDLKGSNVLVVEQDGAEQAKLFDFGVAIELESGGEGRLTSRRTAVGTMTYMAPEQALSRRVDHRSDLFSLGVLAYQMLCGKTPFVGPPTMVALLNATARPPAPSVRVPRLQIDPELEAIALRLMARRPEDRYSSAAEARRALGVGPP